MFHKIDIQILLGGIVDGHIEYIIFIYNYYYHHITCIKIIIIIIIIIIKYTPENETCNSFSTSSSVVVDFLFNASPAFCFK